MAVDLGGAARRDAARDDYARLRAGARGAYERARLRLGVRRATLVTAGVALAAWCCGGWLAAASVPLTFAAWTLVVWRGGALLRGARLGLVAGAASLLLPVSLLRSCCPPDVELGCWVMRGACLAIGAVLGTALAMLLPRGRARATAAGGMALGLLLLVPMKCAALFLGEAFGLLGGLVGVLAAAGAFGTLLDRRRGAFA